MELWGDSSSILEVCNLWPDISNSNLIILRTPSHTHTHTTHHFFFFYGDELFLRRWTSPFKFGSAIQRSFHSDSKQMNKLKSEHMLHTTWDILTYHLGVHDYVARK